MTVAVAEPNPSSESYGHNGCSCLVSLVHLLSAAIHCSQIAAHAAPRSGRVRRRRGLFLHLSRPGFPVSDLKRSAIRPTLRVETIYTGRLRFVALPFARIQPLTVAQRRWRCFPRVSYRSVSTRAWTQKGMQRQVHHPTLAERSSRQQPVTLSHSKSTRKETFDMTLSLSKANGTAKRFNLSSKTSYRLHTERTSKTGTAPWTDLRKTKSRQQLKKPKLPWRNS